jgi:hypothetical protein
MDEKLPGLLDTIIVTSDQPEYEVLAGDLGTIVEIYESPNLAYEIEFVNPNGTTRALLTVSPEQVRLLSENDILTTRQGAIAA